MTEPRSARLDHHTLERYERIWLGLATLMVLLLFAGVIASLISGTFPLFSARGGHGDVGRNGRIDPAKVAAGTSATPFDHPGLVKGPGGPELYIVARAFVFNPPVVHVPAGQPVTVNVTSADVMHGFQVTGTNINAEIMPGHISSFKVTFRRPGEQHVICNEWCGSGHQDMITRFIVDPEVHQ